MPREQQNERSALTLLALLALTPDSLWADASSPLLGITPMMDYFRSHFAKKYAPNSRETVRRFTIHQFEQAGLVVKNPDKPRAINSPDNVYQIEAGALELLKQFGDANWEVALNAFLKTRPGLAEKYAARRASHDVPVLLPSGKAISLSTGEHNRLIKEVIENFCPVFTPAGDVLYVGDAGEKRCIWERDALRELGVVLDEHGKMPDVLVFHRTRNWLVLIEAVTSHGPMNAKRHQELKHLFRGANVGLVFVTAFLNRRAMVRYLCDISWETEVWVADAPTHLIHFNGARFLGPYEARE